MKRLRTSIFCLCCVLVTSCLKPANGTTTSDQPQTQAPAPTGTPQAETSFSVYGVVSGLSGTLVLTCNGQTLSLTENGAFRFPTRLSDGSTYSISIDSEPGRQRCRLSSASGVIASSAAEFSVSCTDKTWTLPASLAGYFNPGGTNPFASSVSAFVDSSYSAQIVFNQPPAGGGLTQVFKSTFRNDVWTHPSNANAYFDILGKRGGAVSIAGNNRGDLLIGWSGWDATALCGLGVPCYQTFKAEYRNGSWSGTPPSDANDNISPDGSDISGLKTAMDASGNAILAWSQSDGSHHQIFKSEYRNGSWTYPSSLSDNISPDGSSAYAPDVAMDNQGNAIITWYQNSHIFIGEYRNGNWSHPANLSDYIDPVGSDASYPRVAMDDNGSAIVVWRQSDGSKSQIFKSEYRHGDWTHPLDLSDNISPDGKSAFEPHVAMSVSGDAVIAWRQYDTGDYLQAFKSEYHNGVWNHPSSLSDNISPNGTHAGDTMAFYDQMALAMDNQGNALLGWRQADGTSQQLFKSEYWNGTWIHPTGLSDNLSPDGQDCFTLDIAMSNPGMGLIVWTQRDHSGDVQIFKGEYR